jgi:thiol-disulfide isomerase/thioredoxin
MRTILICTLLFVVPTLATVGWKSYEAYELQQQHLRAMPQLKWSSRGEVLFFNASWCGPCRAMKPVVAQLRRQGYRFRDIDVDQQRNLAQQYGVRGIPCFVFLENGAEVRRFSGGTSEENLKKLCASEVYHN